MQLQSSSPLLCSAGGRVYSVPLLFFPHSFGASFPSPPPCLLARRRRVLFSLSLSLVFFPPSHGAGTHLQDAAEPADALPLSCVRFVLLTTEVEWERERRGGRETVLPLSPSLPPTSPHSGARLTARSSGSANGSAPNPPLAGAPQRSPYLHMQ